MRKIEFLMLVFLSLIITGCRSKTYTVTINFEDGTKYSRINVLAGDNLSNIELPEKDGYIFVSFQKEGMNWELDTPVESDTTLVATFVEIPNIVNRYTVSFDFGNDLVKTQTIKENDKAIEPTVVNKNKYKFLGWYKGNELYDFDMPVTEDIELVAKYEKMVVIVTFDLNGGDGIVSKEYMKGDIPSMPNEPTRLGYRFMYWSVDDKEYLFDEPIMEDITLKANWEVISYVTVTFDTDGGEELKAQTIPKGSKIDMPIVKRDGYTFLYWEENGREFDFSQGIDYSVKLKAIYLKDLESQ